VDASKLVDADKKAVTTR